MFQLARRYRYIKEILFFLLIMTGLSFCLVPVHRYIQHSFASLEGYLKDRIRSGTGLNVSFASASPNIFRDFTFFNVAVTDASSGAEILSADRVVISVRLLRILTGDFRDCIREVRVESGEVLFDADEENALNALIFRRNGGAENQAGLSASAGAAASSGSGSLSADAETPRASGAEESRPVLERALSGLQNLFRSGVLFGVRNFSVFVNDGAQSLSVYVGSAEAEMNAERLRVDTDSRLTWNRGRGGLFNAVSAEISLTGELSSDLSAGFASLSVDSVESEGFYLSRLGLVAGLRDNVISVTSLQEGQPISLSMTFDQVSKNLAASFSCERLLPFRWLASDRRNRRFAGLQNTTLTAAGSLSYTEETGFLYAARGNAEFSPAFYGGGVLTFDFSGDRQRAQVAALAVNGRDYDADFAGIFDFESKLPEGRLAVRKCSLFDGRLGFSGDFALDASGRTLVCTVPALTVNRAEFADVRASADFSDSRQFEFFLEADDSSGGFEAEASFSRSPGRFFQIYGAFDSVDVANALGGIPERYLKDRTLRSLSKSLASYALTTEVYFSTDFDRFSYNSPRLIVASTEGGLYVLASVNGTETGFHITDISSAPAGIPIQGDVYALIGNSREISFSSDFTAAGIPYTFSGLYADRVFSATGDYGLSFLFRLPDQTGRGTGEIFLNGLPVQAGPAVLSFSLDAEFFTEPGRTWGGTVHAFRMEEVSGFTFLNTVLSASGNFDASGIVLHSVSLFDSYSTLSGYASLGILSDETSGVRRMTADLSLHNLSESETIALSGSLLSGAGDILVEGQCSVRNFPLMRLDKNQSQDNLLSAEVSVSGSPDMLFASANITDASYRLSGSNLGMSGRLLYEDGRFSLFDASAVWRGFRLSEVQSHFSMEDLTASLTAEVSGVFVRSSFSMDVAAQVRGRADSSVQNPRNPQNPQENALAQADSPQADFAQGGQNPPGGVADTAAGYGRGQWSFSPSVWIETFKSFARSFSSELSFSDINWREFEWEKPVPCLIEREPGVVMVSAGDNNELSGFLFDGGMFTLSMSGESPVLFLADGSASGGVLDVDITELAVDIARLWPVVGHQIVAFDGGKVTGDFHIGGYYTDPEFDGTLAANGIVVRAPNYFPTPFDPADCEFVASGKEIHTPPFVVTGNGGALQAEAFFSFNRWIPDEITIFARNLDASRVEAVVDNKYVRANGDVFCDIEFVWTPGLMEISGDAGFESGNFAIKFENIRGEDDGQSGGNAGGRSYSVLADLNVHMGQKVEFHWPSGSFPILRGLLQADEPLKLQADTAAHTYSFKGNAALKGGEFFYFKRNFYLRQGSISFDETQDHFDPRISLRAEVRERDEDGNTVRIIMVVDDDPLSSFNPIFYSDPMRSQTEIMEILGQVASADTSGDSALRDLAVTGTDLLTQIGVFRNAENFIRDALHLDIFSLRTLVLQNAVFGNSVQEVDNSSRWDAGNFLDNTTVYIGKYFGSAVYVDALLHFSYYDDEVYQDRQYRNTMFPTVFGNLLFMPEIGLEVDTPFALIRWGISPVPEDNSVTLSWRFSY